MVSSPPKVLNRIIESKNQLGEFVFECEACKTQSVGCWALVDHLQSADHKKALANEEAQFPCEKCRLVFHTKEQRLEHLSSQTHQNRVRALKSAPSSNQLPTVHSSPALIKAEKSNAVEEKGVKVGQECQFELKIAPNGIQHPQSSSPVEPSKRRDESKSSSVGKQLELKHISKSASEEKFGGTRFVEELEFNNRAAQTLRYVGELEQVVEAKRHVTSVEESNESFLAKTNENFENIFSAMKLNLKKEYS